MNKKIFIFLFFAFIYLPFGATGIRAVEIMEEDKWTNYDDYIVIDEDTTWSGNVVYNNPNKPVVLANGATLTIEKGTHIEILTLKVDMGRIVAEGIKDEKIVFTKAVPDHDSNLKPECVIDEGGMIEFGEKGWNFEYDIEPSIFRYVKFDNMTPNSSIDQDECVCPYINGNCQAMNMLFRSIFNVAKAAELPESGNPAVKFKSGRLNIENSIFENNSIDIETDVYYYGEPMDQLKVINSNFEGNNQKIALASNINNKPEDYLGKKIILMKNNWYGSFDGPAKEGDTHKKGKKIFGDYTLDGYRNNNLISDPVIIIPGIMGSAKIGNKMVLDPILHTYDNLINSLDQNGYQENINLFEFPYEWRNSNVITAGLLKQKIQEVKNITGVSRVDLVAHSMGGLVSRYYIEGPDYQNDVDQLITLGTPHRGSPKSYLTWEAGEVGINFEDSIIENFFWIEGIHMGYLDLKEYIQNKVVSVKELLPDYDYLEKDGKMKNYPQGYPENSLLDFLNKDVNIERLSKINFINIVGDLDSENTISKFRVTENTEEDEWEHGMPENFYDKSTDRGIKKGKGDGTVPLPSAKGIKTDVEMEIKSTHTDLPSKAQCKVLAELSSKSEVNCSYIRTMGEIADILTFGVFSPIDIQVIAPDGKRVGKYFETGEIINEIDGAYYTGSETENEFLTIPNPIDGEYKILTQGTGNGDYKIKISKISESNGETKESTKEISGMAVKGEQEELRYALGEEDLPDENDDSNNQVSQSQPSATSEVPNNNSDDEDDDSEDDDDEKQEEDDASSRRSETIQNDIFDEIGKNVFPEWDLDGKILSDVNSNPNKEKLYEYDEENLKYRNWVVAGFVVSIIFSIAFLIGRRHIDLKS